MISIFKSLLQVSNCVCFNNFTVPGITGRKKLRGDITKRLDLSLITYNLKNYIQESMLEKKRMTVNSSLFDRVKDFTNTPAEAARKN